jgi:hypothetical protein
VPPANTTHFDQLDELKTHFGPTAARRVLRLLQTLSRRGFNDTDSLLRFHEILLFLSAYPHNSAIRRAAEKELRNFSKRVSALKSKEIDLTPLLHPEISGVAGTPVTDTFSFFIVRWLVHRHASEVEIEWDWFEDENRLAQTWPRFIPLLEEDTLVEANIPYREWLTAARAGRSELRWLIERFDQLSKPEAERAELYDSQRIYVRWTPPFDATRTGMRSVRRATFYHRGPLIQRRDIDLHRELEQPSPALEKLSARQGEAVLDRAREASTVRYRELYAFTHGDPKHVYRAELGRGVELFLMGLPAGKRLPLRTCHAAMIYKNGVPVGYFEGMAFCERMEGGFNLYYTFRDGETAWLYAKILNVMHHFAGVTAFSLDPYQIGFENEEGITSGAFWFYRKLGFRPTQTDALKLAENEEQKIAARKGYRTPVSTLRKLAKSPMVFQLHDKQSRDWDRFQMRKIGLRVQLEIGRRFGGDAERMRVAAERLIGIEVPNDFAFVLALIPELDRWSDQDKNALRRILQARMGVEEVSYLRLLQQHARLRKALIKLGS